MMNLSMIIAADLSGVIGKGNDLPWHLGADLRRFKSLTMGHHIVMGRKTFESIGVLLPGRTSVVLTTDSDWWPEKIDRLSDRLKVFEDWKTAKEYLLGSGDLQPFVIGGASIFKQLLGQTNRFFLTRVLAEVPGDTFLPEIDWNQWRLENREEFPADQKNDYPFAFEDYARLEDGSSEER